MQINAITTLTDWTNLGGAWGREGIWRIMCHLKYAGIKKVYWRTFNGGNAIYHSKAASIFTGKPHRQLTHVMPAGYFDWITKIDCTTGEDICAVAVELAHELGMEIHAWYSVFEDEHGKHNSSSFVEQHPEWIQMDREGKKQNSVLDFFFDDVRAYKQKIIDELIAYDFDGMLLDYARHNAVPSGSVSTGIHRLGYNPEIVAAFKERTGKDAFAIPEDDEEWLKFKSEPYTQFITEVRQKMKAKNKDSELGLMLWPVDNLTWNAIDVPKLSAENIIDMVTGMSIKYSFSPQEARDQVACFKAQVSETTRIVPGISCYNGISQTHFDEYVKTVEELGLDEAMLYESDSLILDRLLYSCGNVNNGFPNYKRKLNAVKITEEPDWDSIPKYENFIRIKGDQNYSPRNKTEFQIAYDDINIYCKFFCYSDEAEKIIPVERETENYYLYSLQARNYWYNLDSFNLFLDVNLSHQDFCHFMVEPDGIKIQQTRIDNDWQGAWDVAVDVTDEGWGGVMIVPFTTLDIKNPDTMGINLIRSQKVLEESAGPGTEVSAWFRQWYHMIRPDELGLINFKID